MELGAMANQIDDAIPITAENESPPELARDQVAKKQKKQMLITDLEKTVLKATERMEAKKTITSN